VSVPAEGLAWVKLHDELFCRQLRRPGIPPALFPYLVTRRRRKPDPGRRNLDASLGGAARQLCAV